MGINSAIIGEVEEKDIDGREVRRIAISRKGWTMYYGGPTFNVCHKASVDWYKYDPATHTTAARDWATMKLYDVNGNETETETLATLTEIDIVIPTDIELAGGAVSLPAVLPAGLADHEWRIWAVAAPDIAPGQGGSIPFVDGLQFSDFYEGEDIILDGRTPKLLQYVDASGGAALGYYTNKVRITVQHPTGLNPTLVPGDRAKFMVLLDCYANNIGSV